VHSIIMKAFKAGFQTITTHDDFAQHGNFSHHIEEYYIEELRAINDSDYFNDYLKQVFAQYFLQTGVIVEWFYEPKNRLESKDIVGGLF